MDRALATRLNPFPGGGEMAARMRDHDWSATALGLAEDWPAELAVTVSIGVALCPDDGTDLQTLLRRADEAMYRVKERGRNGFCFYADPPAP